ncbi:MAG TPA: hypothetical protein VFW09_11590 [Solirubrobacteraceae bacterium]|nr:hypothetical protein [Solirubrobacteraceae bacterium]
MTKCPGSTALSLWTRSASGELSLSLAQTAGAVFGWCLGLRLCFEGGFAGVVPVVEVVPVVVAPAAGALVPAAGALVVEAGALVVEAGALVVDLLVVDADWLVVEEPLVDEALVVDNTLVVDGASVPCDPSANAGAASSPSDPVAANAAIGVKSRPRMAQQ